MSAGRHLNQMRFQAALVAGLLGKPKYGFVTSYDPDNYLVKVSIQPEDFETGWLPIEVLQAGNGWGIYAAPFQGDMASVSFLEGDREVGWVTGFIPNDVDHPPSVPEGEIWIVQKAGQFVKLPTDGSLHLQADASTYVVLAPGGGITSKGTWNHDGAFTATGEGTFNGGHTVSQHTHTQPADSHGDTEQPTNKPTG
jgi:phage baseplate assembly protein gpV